MGSSNYAAVIDIFCGLAVATVLLPILVYLYRPWVTRRDKLLGYLDKDSLGLYYAQFYPAQTPNPDKVVEEFKKDFGKNYGRRHYILPILLLASLAAFSAFAAARTLQVWQKVAPSNFALPWIVLSALAGGFTWVINDLIARLRKRDFTVSDIYNWVFRILIAAPFGWAFAQLVKENIGVPLAFLLGAFPTGTLFTIARRLAATRLGISDDPATGTFELEKLQSVTKTNAERFYDEGISTIVQLAYANPVDLTIRTNFDFSYAIDCVSQALLWMYFGDKTNSLYVYSLRGAQEVSHLFKLLSDPATKAQAETTLNAVATSFSLSPDVTRTTLQQVEEDPYSRLIFSIWH